MDKLLPSHIRSGSDPGVPGWPEGISSRFDRDSDLASPAIVESSRPTKFERGGGAFDSKYCRSPSVFLFPFCLTSAPVLALSSSPSAFAFAPYPPNYPYEAALFFPLAVTEIFALAGFFP